MSLSSCLGGAAAETEEVEVFQPMHRVHGGLPTLMAVWAPLGGTA